jgi:ribosomal protein L11 methyltransferase
MREVVLRVERSSVDEILDGLLPIVASGVREMPLDDGRVEFVMRGDGLPALEQIAAVAPGLHTLGERRVSDDWRERRLADYREQTIGGRVVVRPAWAPAPDRELIDIALADGEAFGQGEHPTTRICLELLLGLEPGGSFADLGCGTGVLAILAARLGFKPVIAIDHQRSSIEATRENAARNRVVLETRHADLTTEPPPDAAAFAANVPPEVHLALTPRLAQPGPRVGLISGFGLDDADQVIAGYAARGLRERSRSERLGWVVSELRRR